MAGAMKKTILIVSVLTVSTINANIISGLFSKTAQFTPHGELVQVAFGEEYGNGNNNSNSNGNGNSNNNGNITTNKTLTKSSNNVKIIISE